MKYYGMNVISASWLPLERKQTMHANFYGDPTREEN